MKRILIIEDNPELRENLEEILTLSNYDTESAEDGQIGVRLAKANPPDLILCDVMMPKLDGYGVLSIISKTPKTANIPFIFLTAKSELSDLRRGMNLGADDYITKPFFKDELLQVIETRLKKAERLKKEFSPSLDGWKSFVNEAKGFESLQKLTDQHRTQSFPKKSLLFEEDTNARYLYYILKGKVKAFKTNEFGKELIIDIYKEGDFLGHTDLIKARPHHYSAMALEDTEVCLIPDVDFQKLLYANQDVAARLIRMLASEVIDKEEQLLHLAYHSVRKRVADALLLLQDRNASKPEMGIQILREDLARLVGTAKESVIRMLTEFKKDAYIEIKEGTIYLLEKEKLQNLPG